MQGVSAEPDPLLGKPEHSEEVICAHTEGTELHLQWCSPEDWLHKEGEDLLFEEEIACATITLAEHVTLLGHFSFPLLSFPVLLLHPSHTCVTPRPLGLASSLLGSLYFYFLGVDSL